MSVSLYSPLKVGPYELSHRVVMAPLTRMRAGQQANEPHALNVEYYAQRATKGGLIIAEASPVVQTGRGNPRTPGIYSREQIEGWRKITDAVHARGGIIFLQLWHVGRASHSSFQPGGAMPVAPSAVPISGNFTAMTADGKLVPYETPRALEVSEIAGIVERFREGARNALEAGFDGVEIHGANGYLLEQFLQSRSNTRTDRYGGSIPNRCRLHLEIAAAVSQEVGAERTGIRLSPWGIANDSGEAEPLPLYTHLVRELAQLKLAYLHLIEPRASGTGKADIFREGQPSAAQAFRPMWPGVLIDAGNFDREGAIHAVDDGRADAVAFGRYFISNPDLPGRLQGGAPLTPYYRPTYYGGAEVGYTDYPTLDAQPA